ncbi:glycosyltransferase [Jannaschia rubra]|uniref:glycosyltransferase n=1 Tax=Jannaschia rubra TaxID=282197 RepID=UPI0024937D86|nr:glycosyltransferase [Jannaschia rubra]
MRIALVAHIRHPIAPPFAGGMEAHSWHLARHLADRGHEVTVFASGDSASGMPAGVRVHAVLPVHYDAEFPWHRYHGTTVLTDHLDHAYARAARDLLRGRFDVIHNNGLHRFIPRLAASEGLPMVTSLHVPPFDVLRRAVHDSVAPWVRFTTTSQVQVRRWWPDGAPAEASVLSNGIDLADWPYVPQGDGSAVWCGRITPTKGTHLAAQAARLAGVPLTIFGTIEHRDYFEAEVRPHLSSAIRYGGHLAGPALAREVGKASALLFTPLWDEPFGLAAIEAMATGLPVACIDMGAVREVVGDTGTYAPPHDPEALAEALKAAIGMSRPACRARVERHFSVQRMIDRAEDIYTEAIAGRPVRRPGRSFAPHELRIAPGARQLA